MRPSDIDDPEDEPVDPPVPKSFEPDSTDFEKSQGDDGEDMSLAREGDDGGTFAATGQDPGEGLGSSPISSWNPGYSHTGTPVLVGNGGKTDEGSEGGKPNTPGGLGPQPPVDTGSIRGTSKPSQKPRFGTVAAGIGGLLVGLAAGAAGIYATAMKPLQAEVSTAKAKAESAARAAESAARAAEAAKVENVTLQQSLEEAQNSLAKANDDVSKLKGERDGVKAQIVELHTQIEQSKTQLKAKDTEIADLTARRKDLDEQNANLKKAQDNELIALREFSGAMLAILTEGSDGPPSVELPKEDLTRIDDAATRMVAADQADARIFLLRAWVRAAAGSPGVEEDVRQAIGAAKDQDSLRTLTSTILDRLGRFDEATKLATVPTTDAKADVKAAADRAQALLRIAGRSTGNEARSKEAIEAAFRAADKAVQRIGEQELPDAWLAYYVRGRVHELSGRIDEAIADYVAAEKKAPSGAEKARVLSARARARATLARKSAETAAMRSGIAPGFRGLIASAVLGVVQEAEPSGPFADAIRDAKASLEANPGDPGANIEYGKILLDVAKKADKEQARKLKAEALAHLLQGYVLMLDEPGNLLDGMDPAKVREAIGEAATCLPPEIQKKIALFEGNGGGPPDGAPEDRTPAPLISLADQLTARLAIPDMANDPPTRQALLKLVSTLNGILYPSQQSEPPPPTIARTTASAAEATPTALPTAAVPATETAALPPAPAVPPSPPSPPLAVPASSPTPPPAKLPDWSVAERPRTAYPHGLDAFWDGDYARADALLELAATEPLANPAAFYFLGLSRARRGLDIGSSWRDGGQLERDHPELSPSISRALTRIQGEERNRLETWRR